MTTVYRIVKFKQNPWLQSYIDFNLQKGLETGQDLFKLENNSVFGKTMENVRKYRTVKFESNPNKVRKLVSFPFYEDIQIIEEIDTPQVSGIVMIQSKHKTVLLNKPIYTGMKILDLSKFYMYDIWYNLLKPIFGDALALTIMDTDSFVYFIK